MQSEVHIYFFDTGCETFFGTKFFRDRFRDFFRYQIFSRPVPGLFSVPNFFETGSETFFGTKFFRDRFRYHQKKLKNSREWEFPGPGCHTLGGGSDGGVGDLVEMGAHLWLRQMGKRANLSQELSRQTAEGSTWKIYLWLKSENPFCI